MHTGIHTARHTYIHTVSEACMHTDTHTGRGTYIHTGIQSASYKHIHPDKRVGCAVRHACIHIRIPTHIYRGREAYIHTYI